MAPSLQVFVVEDDPLLREHVVELLSESDGLEVVGQAGSGAETLSKLSTLKPDIVLMDLGLPDMTGQEVTRQLTRREGSPLVMAHTVFDDRDNVLEAIKAGASGYVLKGCTPDELVGALKGAQGRWRSDEPAHRACPAARAPGKPSAHA